MQYKINLDTLGSEFTGEFEDLQNFAEILEQQTGADVVCFDSAGCIPGGEGEDIDNDVFCDALSKHISKYPEAWN